MTEAMLFLQKTILLSYDPRPLPRGFFLVCDKSHFGFVCCAKVWVV